mgnify:FL=1
MVLAEGETLGPELFPLAGPVRANPEAPAATTLEEAERQLIAATLLRFSGQRRRTAQALGIAERTLRDKIARYGLKEDSPQEAARS